MTGLEHHFQVMGVSNMSCEKLRLHERTIEHIQCAYAQVEDDHEGAKVADKEATHAEEEKHDEPAGTVYEHFWACVFV